MYRVIKTFDDLQDGAFHYEVGDVYPRDGLTPTEVRIRELASNTNQQATPLIEKIEEKAEPQVAESNTNQQATKADKKAK